MDNRNKILGINKKVVNCFHRIMLIAILHNTFIAPSQNLIIAYKNLKEPRTYTGSAFIDEKKLTTKDSIQNKVTVKQNVANYSNPSIGIKKVIGYSLNSDIKSGVIGVSNNYPLDDAKDNLFKFYIKDLPYNNKVFLTYELYGIQDYNGVSRSINNRPATGGYVVKNQMGWTTQREEIDAKWLTLGENKIMFSIPKGANYQYQVKNVRLEFNANTSKNLNTSLVVNSSNINYIKDNQLYVKGFLRNYDEDVKVLVEETPLTVINGEFEGFLKLTEDVKNRKFAMIKAFDSKGLLGQHLVPLDYLLDADKIYAPEKNFEQITSLVKAKKNTVLEADGASIIISDSALMEDKEIRISKLRNIDIAPMSSGMVNVTKGGYGYRFLPDGTTFKKPIAIAIEYDENLIPKGHNANEIKTFYFNTQSKTWVAVERDSINKDNKTIISLTNHFTDYVNGIIQTPESPETAGFTPTTMNDIKAVDPSSEMTIISPPEASQKGDANVGYPIKIPSGRNGMQPQLSIEYNSEAGNGWLGQGWNLSTPAITIDTKWGTPTFDAGHESEIYSMNGEQLMYPKQNGKDWMPNRHYDVAGAPAGTYNTQPINRLADLQFTPRKQGGFAKIERLGNATTDYYWKVTNTNGTINWYGGKNGVIPNAVIKNANGNIVHWALYMTEDVFGNTVKYEYTNTTLNGQSGQNANLNGGTIFNISNIKYTGYNDTDYKYEVIFNSTNSIRSDVSINARLGVKQIIPYFLNTIIVKKIDSSLPIRKYLLNIGQGKFNKGQLKSISELDKNGASFYKHTFDYYDDVSVSGSDVYFADGVEQNVCGTEVTPCTDSDNDKVCDEDDSCPTIPGPVSNNGCPIQTNNCYSVTLPMGYIFNECLLNGVYVKVNGVSLSGGPFFSVSEIVSAMQQQHPVTSYDSSTHVLTISNNSQTYSTFVIYFDEKNPCSSLKFKQCEYLPKLSQKIDYSNYFSNLLNNNTFSLTNGIASKDSCPDGVTNDEFLIPGYLPSFDSSASSLGSSKSKAISAGFYIGIGIGSNRFTKMTTFGMQFNWGNDKSEAMTALIDINGDGLDDIVSKEGSALFYKKHRITRTYNSNNEPVVTHSFDVKKPIIGIDNFYRSFGRNRSSNFQITFGLKKVGGFVGWDKSKSKSETDMYFTDGNGDGLMDIVRDGVVYFNRLDANGNPKFIPDSKETENLVITAAPRTVEAPDEFTEEDVTLPAFDVVKVWEAPADGNIKITNSIQLTDPTKEAIVTVEAKKNPKCYKVSFPIPRTVVRNYVVGISNIYSSLGLISFTEWWDRSSLNPTPISLDLKYFIGGNVNSSNAITYPSDPNHPLYVTNGNYSGRTNFAVGYYYLLNNNNNSNGLYYGIMSNDFLSRHLQTTNQISSNYPGTTYTLARNYNAYQRIVSACYATVEDLVFYGGNITTSNASLFPLYIKTNWSSNTTLPDFCGGYKLSSSSWAAPYTENVTPITTNIAINSGALPNNPYTLWNNNEYVRFQNYIQNQYPGSSVTVNNQTKIITVIVTTNQTMSNITLTATNGGSSNTYSFAEVPCSQVGLREEKDSIALGANDWKSYQCTQEELEFVNKKSIADGFGLTQPFVDNSDMPSFITIEGKSIDGEYGYIVKNNITQWFDNKQNAITEKTKIEKLNEILSGFMKSQSENLSKEIIEEEIQIKKQAQKEAQAWLDEYHKKQEEKESKQIDDFVTSRTVNQNTCNETPTDLCLLYGSQLSASNANVTNTITNDCLGQTLAVRKGDRIYFRVHSVQNGNPPVNWNPKVEYTSPVYTPVTDANGHKPYSSSYADGFVLSSKLPATFPGNSGTTKITWTPFTITPTDKVTYQIVKQTVSSPISDDDNPPTVNSSSIIFTQVCNPNTPTTINPTSALNNIVVTAPSGVAANLSQTFFYFKVISSSNVDWKNIVWKPEMEFTTTTPISPNSNGSSPEGNLTSVTKEYPVPDYDLYRLFPCGTAYAKKNIAAIGGNGNLRIMPNLSGVFSSGDNGQINFVVKRGSTFIGNKVFTITNGSVSINNPSPIMLGNSGASTLEIMYTVDGSQSDGSSASLLRKIALTGNTLATISYGNTTINVPKTEIILYQKTDPKFGSFFRQWGQFMYRPENVTGALPTGIGNTKLIKEDALQVTLSQGQANQLNTDLDAVNDNMTAAQLQSFQNSHMNYINSLAFLSANAKRELINNQFVEKWIGFHNENYASEFAFRAEKMEQSIIDFEDNTPSIEQGVIQTGAYAISKYAKGHSDNNFSAGVSAFGVGVNGSISNNGLYNALSDYVDYNGDRYPDIITTQNIQFTNKTGGLFTPTTNNGQDISTSSSDSSGFGATGSFGKNSDDGGDKKSTASGFQRFDGFRGNSGGGISGSFTNGHSITQRLWTDINGDGLSDMLVTNAGVTDVTLNFGPTTSNNIGNSWGALPLFNSDSNGVSGGLGVNKWNGSVEAGVSLTTSWNKTTNTLVDLNGDGLLDMVYANNNLGVKLNTGNTFVDKGIWTSNYNLSRESASIAASLNAGITFALIWRFWAISFKIPAVNINGTPLSTSTNKTKKTITDYDGDGYVDLVEEINSSKVRIYHSRIRRTDKLKSVTNPLGGKFTIDYKVQPVSYDNPSAKWTMSTLTIEDKYDKVNDGKDVYKKQFIYEKGRYDRREREFYGYKTVKVEDYALDTSGNEVLYRTNISNYHNQSYFLNGLLEDSYIVKGGDVNKKFSRTRNFYELFKLNNTNDEVDFSTSLPFTFDVGGSEGRRSACVLLTKTVNELYELTPSPQLTTEARMKYDQKGQIIEYTNKGNIADTSDDYSSVITYHNTMTGLHIINVPKSIKVSTASGGVMRERTTDVDTSRGSIIKISANNNGTWSETSMKYDQYGNLAHIQYPQNTAGQSMFYHYEYDPTFHKYVVGIKDAFGYSSTAAYDSDFDKPLEVVDLTGNKMIYEYDTFGRTTIILAPKEMAAGKKYTIKFEYFPYLLSLPSGSGVNTTNFVPVALTSHFDPQHPTNDIDTYTFVDGLARPIQIKKDIYINNGTSASANFVEALSISGKTSYDEFGRSKEQYHPWWEVKANTTKFLLNEYASPYKAIVEYDELDRPVKNIDPEGNISTMQYSIAPNSDGIIAIKTKSDVDQNGTQHIVTETYKDVSGKVISTKNQGGATGNIWTKFKYNEIGELLSYTDTENIVTTYKYDMFGRKIEINHPDNGKTTYKYDNVNLVSLQTANLQTQGSTIDYEYEINRISHIKYPNTPNGAQNIADVFYKYGSSGNNTGRVIWQKDATGQQEMEYGNMGEMIANVRTVVGPNIPTRVFKTSWNYDSWNRLQTMQYPDGEKVSYAYDLGGNLIKMAGELNGAPYTYIQRIDYDYFEQRSYLLYGNRTETFYNYSTALRRLSNLNVKTSDANSLFNNSYSYDKVGNVLNLTNTAGVTANNMAGGYQHQFKYDNLNRLVAAQGSFTGSPTQIALGNDANSSYNLKMKYNDTHGILAKTQDHSKNGSVFVPNTYDNTYTYIPNSHKVVKITDGISGEIEQFKYDRNGNVIAQSSNTNQKGLFWDESNRLRVVVGDHAMQHYIYDASGERVLKANSDMEAVYENGSLTNPPSTISINGYTSYPSAFMVITADGVYSKHYYAGKQRIVSRLGDNDASIFEVTCGDCKQSENGNEFDGNALKQAQITDLRQYADKANKGKIVLKPYKPIPLAKQEEALVVEDTAKDSQKVPVLTPIYYYHPDHLGTSTALTDFNGNAYQFFLNLPFGETMAQQLGSNYYNTPYKFNGKELDEETGLYYYGARYYDPKTSIWLSVDPLAEKFPAWNPYNYTMENPVKYVDPTGMSSESPEDPRPKWLDRVLKGQSAHRALTQYLERINPSGNTWRPNKAVNAPSDITRPDVVYDNGQQAGVWELKPAPPAPSSILAAPEAKTYAKALNAAKGTDRFKTGTSGGAPSPFLGELYAIDEATGNKFLFSIPDPNNGAIFWSEVKDPKKEPNKVPDPVNVPIHQPITNPNTNDRSVPVPKIPHLTTPQAVGLGILLILGALLGSASPQTY